MAEASDELTGILKKRSVLVVDDAGDARAIFRKFFEDLGAKEVFEANDGELAFELMVQEKIDLVVCDWNMPNVSGLDLLKNMKGDERTRKIPFLMVTADLTSERVNEAIEAGAFTFMGKPLNKSELLKKLKFIFDFRRTLVARRPFVAAREEE